MTRTFFIDESVRKASDGFVYVLAAVRSTAGSPPLVKLRSALLTGQRYVHWRDESAARRKESVTLFNSMAFDVSLVVAERVPNRSQERARATGMLALADELGREGATLWEIERRRGQLDQRDKDTIKNAERQGRWRAAPDLRFVAKSSSPVLWVADAASSAASEYFAGSGRSDHWWRSLRFARLVVLHVEP